MATKNDAVIVQLQAKVDAKRKEIGDVKRFAPKTNCSMHFNGTRYNIHTLTEDVLVLLLVQLKALQLAADVLESQDMPVDVMIDGYAVETWFGDLAQKHAINLQSVEVKKLHALEARLKTLMSDDKKAELELEEIMKELD